MTDPIRGQGRGLAEPTAASGTHGLTRRGCLTALASASLGFGMTRAAAAGDDRLRDYIRMRGALDDRLVVGDMCGHYFAVIDDEIVPLFGVLSATFTRWRAGPDGTWWRSSFEHAYYTDNDSGEVLDEWRNPVNGKTCKVPVWTSQPALCVLKPDLSTHMAKALPPGFVMEDRVVSIETLGSDRVVLEQVKASSAFPGASRPYRYGELVTLRAPAAALRQADSARVPCSFSFINVSGYRPWMQMDAQQPGHLMAQGAGDYGAALDALPAVWLKATKRLNPAWWADPARSIEALFPPR